jgi:hypothetical protein
VALRDGFGSEKEIAGHEKGSYRFSGFFGVADPENPEPGERFSRIYESPCK